MITNNYMLLLLDNKGTTKYLHTTGLSQNDALAAFGRMMHRELTLQKPSGHEGKAPYLMAEWPIEEYTGAISWPFFEIEVYLNSGD